MQPPKEFDGKRLESTTKDRFDLGDGDEKKKYDELKAEIEIKGCLSWTKTNHLVQDVNKAKIEAKRGLEGCCVALMFEFETGHREETEKAVQDAWNQLDKNKLAENDEFEAHYKNWEEADMVIDMPGAAQHQHEVMQRLVANIQSIQKRSRYHVCNSSTGWWMIPRSCKGRPPPARREDGPRGLRGDSAGKQADEVPEATPFGKADRTKKKRKAKGVHLFRASSESCSVQAWPPEPEQKYKRRPEVSHKGENAGVRKTTLTRKAREVSWSVWRGWKERAPSLRTRSTKPASRKTTPKS